MARETGHGGSGRRRPLLLLADTGGAGVLVALEVYGFRTSHLFSQEIWAPEGRARLLQFGALYLGAVTCY